MAKMGIQQMFLGVGQGPLVNIEDRLLTPTSGGQVSWAVLSDGRVQCYLGPGNLPYLSGEWYTPGQTAGIGNDYQILFELQAGSINGANEAPVWTSISSARSISLFIGPGGGRVKISIRDTATSTVQDTALVWSDAMYAP